MRLASRSLRASTVMALSVVIVAASMPDLAFAKRLGSGSSVGRQQSGISQRRAEPSQPASAPAQQAAPQGANAAPASAATNPAAAQRPAPAAQTPAQQPARNRWLGPLAGLAAGLGIAALFSHLGLGDELASFISSALMIGLLVFAGLFIYRMLTRSRRAAETSATRGDYAYAGAASAGQDASAQTPSGQWGGAAAQTSAPMQRTASGSSFGATNQPALGSELNVYGQPVASMGHAAGTAPVAVNPADVPLIDLPDGFDSAGFLRAARNVFVRLQAANDQADVATIREFVSDDLLAIFRDEIASRGATVNVTDVVELDAELVAYERDWEEHIASVLFNGRIRETAGGPVESFSEVWNLSRPVRQSGGWTLVGIQSV